MSEPGLLVTQRLIVLGVVLGCALLLHLLAPILTPFLMAMTLAYLWDPVVDRLEALGLGRTLAVVVVFLLSTLLLVALLLVLVPLLGQQMHTVADKVPLAVEWYEQSLQPWLQQQFNISPSDIQLDKLKQALMANWQSAGGIAQGLLLSATSSSLALLGWITNLVLVPVVGFYLLRDWDVMVAKVRETLPRAWEPRVVQLARECDEVVGAFLRGQFLVMLALGVCYTVGLMLIGLDLALLIGMLSGLAAIVPYLGLLIGVVSASIAALMQFGDWTPLLWVALVFTLSQLLEGMYLTPKLVGDRIGLHPVVVIFAVMAGGQLFGFTGVLLALPVSAVIMVLLRHVHEQYRASRLYGPTAAPATAPAEEPEALPAEPGMTPADP